MSGDDWVTLAMEDSHLVAEVLLRLRAAVPTSQRPRPSPPQSWTIHQRRSRPQPVPSPSNKSEAPRASPSTPLSWSGATSVSGGGVPIVDAVDSAQPNPNRSVVLRSKVTPPGEATLTKRPRKKKTVAALKAEAALLLEEQMHLKRELAILQATCEQQVKENESLKKMNQLDIQIVGQQGERSKALAFRCDRGMQQPNNDLNAHNDKLVLPDLNAPAGEVS